MSATKSSSPANSSGDSAAAETLAVGPDFALAFEPGLTLLDGSEATTAVLLGGSPLVLLRLKAAAQRLLAALRAGESVGAAATQAGVSPAAAGRFARTLVRKGMARTIRPPQPAGTCEARLSFAVVIPVLNRAASLNRLLTSIRASNPSGDYRIVVVDDGSTDDSATVARDWGCDVVSHESPHGPAAARSDGVAHLPSSVEVVVFLDSDCALPSGFEWDDLLAPFADPSVAAVAPRIVAMNDTATSTLLRAYEHARSPLDLGPTSGNVVPRTRLSYVPAAALAVRISALQDVGGFDEEMHVGEDVDLVWRLHHAGHDVRYESSVTVAHDHRSDWRGFLQRRMQYGTSAAALDQKHPKQVAPLAVSAWSAGGWVSLFTFHPLGLAMTAALWIGSGALLPRKLEVVAKPNQLAWRLVRRGHLGAGRQLASASWRAYLPLLLLVAPWFGWARRVLLASAVIPNAMEWRERRPAIDPLRYIGVRCADDAAYCAGTWLGALRAKSFRCLVPDLRSWPGRTKPKAIDPQSADPKQPTPTNTNTYTQG